MLPILHAGPDYCVLNKPSGIPTYDFVARFEQAIILRGDFYHNADVVLRHREEKPAAVHRLDKPTSGCLIVGDTSSVRRWLSNLFRDHRIQKTYMAIVHGQVEADRGIIDFPLLHTNVRDGDAGYSVVTVNEAGKESRTGYEVVGRSHSHTLVRLQPYTGRTHQLRVHMAAIGHPIVGDCRYGRGSDADTLCLHSSSISFPERKRGTITTVTAPLPAHMSTLIETVGLGS